MKRQDLPRCATCRHWRVLEWSKGAHGECSEGNRGEDVAVWKGWSCYDHTAYDEPETQTETDDDDE